MTRTSVVEDAKNVRILLIQEEAFLASVPVLTFILFFMLGVGLCPEDICKRRRDLKLILIYSSLLMFPTNRDKNTTHLIGLLGRSNRIMPRKHLALHPLFSQQLILGVCCQYWK